MTHAIQEAVNHLEDYKRRLGRNFDRANTYDDRVYYFNRYNECENCIQMLTQKYHVTRKYKPYKLSLDVL